jgi:hypothetical protein
MFLGSEFQFILYNPSCLFYLGKFVFFFTFSIVFIYIYLDLFIYNQNNSAFGLQVRRSWSLSLEFWPSGPDFKQKL